MMNPEDLLGSMNYPIWSTSTTYVPQAGCTHTPPTKPILPLVSIPRIENVIFNPPVTIILWEDGTKTIVKCHEEEFSEEHGFAMAVIKKLYGSRSSYLNIISRADRQPKLEKKVKKAK